MLETLRATKEQLVRAITSDPENVNFRELLGVIEHRMRIITTRTDTQTPIPFQRINLSLEEALRIASSLQRQTQSVLAQSAHAREQTLQAQSLAARAQSMAQTIQSRAFAAAERAHANAIANVREQSNTQVSTTETIAREYITPRVLRPHTNIVYTQENLIRLEETYRAESILFEARGRRLEIMRQRVSHYRTGLEAQNIEIERTSSHIKKMQILLCNEVTNTRRECAICFDDCCDTTLTHTNCEHAFCMECVSNYFTSIKDKTTKPGCPTCRTDLTSLNVYEERTQTQLTEAITTL
jgi:hypothetical protein